MMWLESNTNYNYGFNHAWIALQGAAAETAADNVAHKKLISRISQLEAENATLAADLFTLQQAESRNPTSAEVVKKAEPVLGYTAFEPQEVDVVVTYWRGITVTRNIGGKTIGVVIEVPAGQALPDEEWEEATAADYTAYTAEVQAAEATQQVPPKRSRTRTAAAV